MRGFPISCGFVLVQPCGLDLFYGRMHAIISLEYPNMKLIKALSAAAVLGLAVAPAANAQTIIAGGAGAGGAGAVGLGGLTATTSGLLLVGGTTLIVGGLTLQGGGAAPSTN